MENKNLNDIVIDENDNKKKTQLKNILTLLALLFIILVISIVITKLILGDNSENAVEKPVTVESTQENTNTDANDSADSTVAAIATAGLAAASLNSNEGTATTTQPPKVEERNITKPKSTSSSKDTLRDYTSSKKEAAKTSNKASSSSYVQPKYISTTERAKTTTTASAAKATPTKSYNPSRGYYIKVGAYEDPAAAIDRIKAIQLNYRTIKSSEGLTRVLIGPFYSQKDAEDHLAKAKESVAKDAYITKIK